MALEDFPCIDSVLPVVKDVDVHQVFYSQVNPRNLKADQRMIDIVKDVFPTTYLLVSRLELFELLWKQSVSVGCLRRNDV
jgi:hypothetical protein